MNLSLKTITRVLDYRAGETIEDWLARTGLTRNHMRVALNALKLFGDDALPYEPDASGYIPSHDDLAAVWRHRATAPPEPESFEEALDAMRRLPPVDPGMAERFEQLFEMLGFPDNEAWSVYAARVGITPQTMEQAWRVQQAEIGIFKSGPISEACISYWSIVLEHEPRPENPARRSALSPGQDEEIPWWLKKGRAAAAHRAAAEGEAVEADKPFWAKTIRPAGEKPAAAQHWRNVRGGVKAAAQRKARDAERRSWWSNVPNASSPANKKRNGLTAAEIERRLQEMDEAEDLNTGETWPDYCRRHGITREDMIKAIISLGSVQRWQEENEMGRSYPQPRSRERVFDR